MEILEDVSGKPNYDLWLAPMIVVPKRDNTPRRVIDFSLLNKFCKRSAEATLDTNLMATAVPIPEEGNEIFFSCLDAWNGYHSIPWTTRQRIFLGSSENLELTSIMWPRKDFWAVEVTMWHNITPSWASYSKKKKKMKIQ